jgi:hypothetical protein
LTFGMPWVAINTASAALSIASTIAAAVKSIREINAQPGAAASTAGTGGTMSSPPPTYTGGAGAMAAPQITATGGQNPTAQIAQTIGANQNRPIQAYVVSGQVSSQQALDRRTSVAATFS